MDTKRADQITREPTPLVIPLLRRRRRTGVSPYLWVMPALLLYTVFKLVPLIAGVWLALLRWDGIETPVFVGLQNFERMLEDEKLVPALLNNIAYAFGTVTGKMILGFGLALLLNQKLRGRDFYRTVLFMPVMMSFVVVGILWSLLMNSQFGLLNVLLQAIGLEKVDWLGNPRIALLSLMLVDIWKWFGFHMVIFLAGLQIIPQELLDAARVDGASPMQTFWNVTLPLLRPVLVVNVALALMGAFNVFDIPYIMTEGGPVDSTNVLSLHSYIQAFKFSRFGYGSALSYTLLLLISLISMLQIWLMSRNGPNRQER